MSTLNLKILPRDLKSKDTRHLLSLIFSQWLSLSTSIIQAVIDVVPSPSVAQATRIPKMLYPDLQEATTEPRSKLEKDLWSGSTAEDSYVEAYVSKMFAVRSSDLPENKGKPITAEEMRARAKEARAAREAAIANGSAESSTEQELVPPAPTEDKSKDDEGEEEDASETLLGFARLYSGTIKRGANVYCVLPKFEPGSAGKSAYIKTAKVEGLYLMMGRELVAVDTVRAGNIFAIKGLEGKIWRSGTICAPGVAGVPEGEELKDECIINLGAVNRVVSFLQYAVIHERGSDVVRRHLHLFALRSNPPDPETCRNW